MNIGSDVAMSSLTIEMSPEEVYTDESDGPTPRERALEAYHTAVAHLDNEEILSAACAFLASHAEALVELVQLQRQHPYEDVGRAQIHPDLAQQVARECLVAIAASIDNLAGQRAAVEG